MRVCELVFVCERADGHTMHVCVIHVSFRYYCVRVCVCVCVCEEEANSEQDRMTTKSLSAQTWKS